MDPMLFFCYIIRSESFHHETHGSLRFCADPVESLLLLVQYCLIYYSERTFVVDLLKGIFQASSPCVIIRQIELNLEIS